jgi:hypothetical protein
MSDPNAVLATLAAAAIVLASVSLVLSRLIPDEYDRRVAVRVRGDRRQVRRPR